MYNLNDNLVFAIRTLSQIHEKYITVLLRLSQVEDFDSFNIFDAAK